MESIDSLDLKYHPSISCMTRSLLFEWLMKISYEYKILSESFETAALLIDECIKKDIENNEIIFRYCNNNPKIIGITCLWIAIKCNDQEKNLFTIDDLSEITNNLFQSDKFLN